MLLPTPLFLVGKLQHDCTLSLSVPTHLLTSHHLNAVTLPAREVLYVLILNESKVYKVLSPFPSALKKRWTRERQWVLGLPLVVSSSGLTLAGCLEPTKTSLPLPSPVRQGIENIMKGLWVEIRTERDHSSNTIMVKNQTQIRYIN